MGDCVNCGGLVDPGSGWSPQVVGALLWVMFVRIVREKRDANECA
jgi:hypothetical protein